MDLLAAWQGRARSPRCIIRHGNGVTCGDDPGVIHQEEIQNRRQKGWITRLNLKILHTNTRGAQEHRQQLFIRGQPGQNLQGKGFCSVGGIRHHMRFLVNGKGLLTPMFKTAVHRNARFEGLSWVQGQLLILDAVSTNRIVLNAMLEPACYDIAQGETILCALKSIRQNCPDLVLTSWSLPDGTAADLREAMDKIDPDREIPVIAIARGGDIADRRGALHAGLADLLVHPLDETMLQARLRSILRARPSTAAYDLSETQFGSGMDAGFAEAPDTFARNDRIAIVGRDLPWPKLGVPNSVRR